MSMIFVQNRKPAAFSRENFWKGIGWVTLGAVALMIFMLAGCTSHATSRQPMGSMMMPVTMMPVVARAYPDQSEFMAEVDSKHATDVRPQVSSRIVAVLISDGARAQKGQPLFQLDTSQMAPNLSAAKSDLAFSERQLKRYRELSKDHTVSEKDTEEYATTYSTQRQKVKSLEADLNYYTVRAPFSGTIGTLIAKVGDMVDPTTMLTTITDDRHLEIDVALSSDDRPRVRIGTVMTLLSTDEKPIGQSRVSYIAPQVDPATQTILVKARTFGSSALSVDQHLKARLIWGEKRAVLVPMPSVFRIDGQPFVYRAEAGKDGKRMVARMQAVTLGPIVNQDVVIVSGLKPGQTLITGGIQKLQDGVPVMQMPPSGEKKQASL